MRGKHGGDGDGYLGYDGPVVWPLLMREVDRGVVPSGQLYFQQ